MTKKIISLLLAVLMMATLVVGCSGKKAENSSAPAASSAQKPAEKKVIRLSWGGAEAHPTYKAAVEFKRVVEEKLPGKYEIKIFPNATLGDDLKATEAVRAGQLDAVVTSLSPLVGIVKEGMLFDLPFLFSSYQEAHTILDGPVGKAVAAKMEEKGLIVMGWWENGFRNLTNSKKEVKSPEDLAGLKIRVMQNELHLATWKALGANPTPMAYSEVFTALQQHVIDGQENPLPTINDGKFHEVQKYLTLSGHIYGPHILLFGKKLWDSIPEADRKVFLEAQKASTELARKTSGQQVEDLKKTFKDKGLVITELSDVQKKAFQDKVAPIWTQYEEKIGKDLVTLLKEELKKIRK